MGPRGERNRRATRRGDRPLLLLGNNKTGVAVTVNELVGSVRKLRVSRIKGQRASCQPIALLSAIGRAQLGAPRLTPWPETERDLTCPDSLTDPSIGSFRRSMAPFGGCGDDQLLFRFNRERTTTLVTAIDLAADSPERRVAAVTGIVVEGTHFDAALDRPREVL